MIKRILLWRHAHYDPTTLRLSPEGLKQAEKAAQNIVDAGYVPPEILHAPAPRVVATARALHKAFRKAGKDIRLKEVENLHEDGIGAKDVFDSFRATDNRQDLIVAVTHQPVVRGLAILFGSRIHQNAPGHAQAYVFEADVPDWSAFGRAQVKQVITP